MDFEVKLPKLGESILGATVVQWLKKVGDEVALDEPLLEVSTDKVNSEIPSPVAGVLTKILAQEEEELEIGAPLALISTTARAPVEKESRFSPAVLHLAQKENISLEELSQLKGSGEGGRVTKKDVEALVKKDTPSTEAKEQRLPMSGMRKAIAENMVRSFYEAPHASVVGEADVTDLMQLVSREKQRFLATHGVKLTLTSFLIQTLAKTVKQFPMLNASLEKETIVMKQDVNVGIAISLEKGLIVPVIRNCEEKNLVHLAKSLAKLSEQARTGKLLPDQVQEGTITLTNFGMAKALIGVPIIRHGEVAILGVGTVQKRVVVREDDSLAIRQMLYLTLTFDHRVIDGIYGCQFLSAFKEHLEGISLS